MKSWLEFESRFRALIAPLQFVRLDRQWGAAGEYWTLAGSQSLATQEFETLSALAGKQLPKVLKPDSENHAVIVAEPDDKIRWYRALVLLTGQFQHSTPAWQNDDQGNFAGHLFHGSLQNLGQNAANLCLHFQAALPLPEKSRAQRLWDDYGSKIFVGVVLALVAALLKLWLG